MVVVVDAVLPDVQLGWGDPLDCAVADGDVPTVFGESVVPAAGQNELGDVGVPAVLPADGVVDLAAVPGDPAAGERAPAVPGEQHDPLAFRREAFGAAQVERL